MVASEAEGRAEALRRIVACRTAQAEELDLGGVASCWRRCASSAWDYHGTRCAHWQTKTAIPIDRDQSFQLLMALVPPTRLPVQLRNGGTTAAGWTLATGSRPLAVYMHFRGLNGAVALLLTRRRKTHSRPTRGLRSAQSRFYHPNHAKRLGPKRNERQSHERGESPRYRSGMG
jgi:hypothetical protein